MKGVSGGEQSSSRGRVTGKRHSRGPDELDAKLTVTICLREAIL
jgi:hypothetical protein